MSVIKLDMSGKLCLKVAGFEKNTFTHFLTTARGWDQQNLFEEIANCLDVPFSKVLRIKQVHGTEVQMCFHSNFKMRSEEKICDGIITDQEAVVLTTSHADCTPLFYYAENERSRAVGIAHAGWRGTLNDIHLNMILALTESLQMQTQDIRLAIGPHISVKNYEFGEELIQPFLHKFGEDSGVVIIHPRTGKYHLNLERAHLLNALRSGLERENIFVSDYCTYDHEELFSYRRDRTSQRMCAVMMLNVLS